MRGSDRMQEALFPVAKLEDFVPPDHPPRPVRLLVNEALGGLNGLFNTIYADSGRASIAPEKLLRAMLVQVFFSVRSLLGRRNHHHAGLPPHQRTLGT